MPSTFPRVPVYAEEWGDQFLASMREYITGLEYALDEGTEAETISGEPFCGCSDCYEREGYLMAVALSIEGYEAGKVRLVGAGA